MSEELRLRFLVAEPDESIAEVLRDRLHSSFEGCDVTVVQRGEEAWRLLRAHHRDLAILAIRLEGRTGDWVLRQIQGTGRKLPVIMTSAHATEAVEAKMLRLGADDFLPKPFPIEVLVERVRARLRRTPPERRTHTHVGDLTICHRRCSLRLNGHMVSLTRLEHDVLAALAERPGSVVPGTELMQRIWDRTHGDPGVLYFAVHELRKKLKPFGGAGLIRNQRGVGYALAAGPHIEKS